MRQSPSPRWIVGMLLLLVLGPPLALWWLTPSVKPVPIGRLMPAHASAILRLLHSEEGWRRHWAHRRGPTPEAALQEILVALDQWPRWIKKYGESGAWLRLTLYQKTIFHALGDEAWLVFGEWGGDGRPGTGQVGLVAFFRGDTSLKSRIGPLMDLLMEGYRIERSTVAGAPVYEYHDRRMGRSMTFCQTGGWICASLRRRDSGPLKQIIEQARSDDQGAAAPVALTQAWPAEAATITTSTLSLAAFPNLFWGHLRQFGMQRERGFSTDSEKSIKLWQQRLEGVRRMVVTQSGASLLNLRLDLQGERPARLNAMLKAATELSTATTPVEAPPPLSVTPENPVIAQLDMARGFARLSMSLAGLDWETALKKAGWLDFLAPGLRALLAGQLVPADPTIGGRIGLAFYPTPAPPLPGLLYWLDQPPQARWAGAPARLWFGRRDRLGETAAGDQCRWLTPFSPPLAPRRLLPEEAAWMKFEDSVWQRSPAPPLAGLSLNFGALADDLNSPTMSLIGKKARKKVKRWQATLRALALGLGGVGLRLDGAGDGWTLECRTP